MTCTDAWPCRIRVSLDCDELDTESPRMRLFAAVQGHGGLLWPLGAFGWGRLADVQYEYDVVSFPRDDFGRC